MAIFRQISELEQEKQAQPKILKGNTGLSKMMLSPFMDKYGNPQGIGKYMPTGIGMNLALGALSNSEETKDTLRKNRGNALAETFGIGKLALNFIPGVGPIAKMAAGPVLDKASDMGTQSTTDAVGKMEALDKNNPEPMDGTIGPSTPDNTKIDPFSGKPWMKKEGDWLENLNMAKTMYEAGELSAIQKERYLEATKLQDNTVKNTLDKVDELNSNDILDESTYTTEADALGDATSDVPTDVASESTSLFQKPVDPKDLTNYTAEPGMDAALKGGAEGADATTGAVAGAKGAKFAKGAGTALNVLNIAGDVMSLVGTKKKSNADLKNMVKKKKQRREPLSNYSLL